MPQHRIDRAFFSWLPLCIFFMYQFVLRVSPNVMTKEILEHYQIHATDFGVLTSLYYLGYAAMQVPIGILLDRYGPRFIATSFALLCALGGVLFGLSNSWVLALCGRFLIGVGSSGAYISSTKVIRSWSQPKYFSLFMAITATIGLLTAHQSGIITTHLMDRFGWQKAILYLSAGGVALAATLWMLVKGGGDSGTPQRINARFLKRLIHTLQQHKVIWVGLWGCFLTGPLYVLGDVWGISFYETVFGLSKNQATQAATIIYFGMACGGPVVATFSEEIKAYKKLMIAGLAFLMALILMGEILFRPPYAYLLALNFIMGVCSSYQIIIFGLVVLNIPQSLSGVTFGIVNTINMLSGFVYLPLVGCLLDLFWDNQWLGTLRLYSSFAYQMSVSSIVVGLVIGGLGFVFLKLPGE